MSLPPQECDPDCVPVAFDLSITKTDGVDNVALGDLLTYTITVYNPFSDVTGAIVTDTLPTGLIDATWFA